MLAYSRGAMAGPLRELGRVVEMVKKGQFHPDSTRSGRFVVASGASSSAGAPAMARGVKRPLPVEHELVMFLQVAKKKVHVERVVGRTKCGHKVTKLYQAYTKDFEHDPKVKFCMTCFDLEA
jgi:uridine phosphorylase